MLNDIELVRQHRKMYQDFYEGDGEDNLPIVARIRLAEDGLKRILEGRKEQRLLALGIIATVIAEIIVHLFVK